MDVAARGRVGDDRTRVAVPKANHAERAIAGRSARAITPLVDHVIRHVAELPRPPGAVVVGSILGGTAGALLILAHRPPALQRIAVDRMLPGPDSIITGLRAGIRSLSRLAGRSTGLNRPVDGANRAADRAHRPIVIGQPARR